MSRPESWKLARPGTVTEAGTVLGTATESVLENVTGVGLFGLFESVGFVEFVWVVRFVPVIMVLLVVRL